MKQKAILVIALLALVSMMIMPVMAETLTGELSSGAGWLSNNYGTAPYTGWQFGAFISHHIVNIELTSNTKSIVHFDATGHPALFSAGAPSGAQTPFNFTIGTHVLATGQFGYQRLFDGAWPIPNEIAGYQYWIMDSWNITGLSGAVTPVMIYNSTAVYGYSNPQYTTTAGVTGDVPASYFYTDVSTVNKWQSGNYTYNRDQPFKNRYNATKPLGLGIGGVVVKTVNGTNYPSRAYIVDGITSAPITSQGLVTPSDFTFSVSSETIKICVRNSAGVWFNSSTLFSSTTPPVTPTPYTSLYSIEVVPNYGEITNSYSATSTYAGSPIGTNVSAFTVICTSGIVSGSCLSNGEDPVFLKKGDGYWYQRNFTADTQLTTAFPSPLSLTFTAPGTYSVEGAYFETTGGGGKAYDTVTIVSTGISKTFTVKVQDAATSGYIYGSTVQILNTSGWSNVTTTNGIRVFNAKVGEILGYGASADAGGYLPSSILYTQVTSDMERTVSLTKYISVPVGNTTLYVFVKDSRNLNPIGGALIRLNDGQMKTTPATGLSTFTVLNGSLYTITTTKTGYYSLTRSMIVVTTSNQVSMEMNPIYETTATPTGIPTQDTRDDTKKATDSFSKWMNILGDITDIAIGVVIIWLMWLTVYMITGGKIIDKIMKRGRR